MKMIVNTVLKKALWLNLFAIIFCIVGCLEDRTPQKPPLQISWIGDKRVGPGGISIPAGDDIHIGVSRDPENPQIKIKPGKGEIVIRIDVNNPHGQKPHINIQYGKVNIHTDKEGIEISNGDRITIRIGNGKIVIEKNDKKVAEYEIPGIEGEDITIEQEEGGRKINVKKGEKKIGTIEIGAGDTRINAGDKEVEVSNNKGGKQEEKSKKSEDDKVKKNKEAGNCDDPINDDITIGVSDDGRPYIIITINGKPKVIWIPKQVYEKLKGKKVTAVVSTVGNITIIIIYADGVPVWEIHIGNGGHIVWQGQPKGNDGKKEGKIQPELPGHDIPGHVYPLPESESGDFPGHVYPLPEPQNDFPGHVYPLPPKSNDFPGHVYPLPPKPDEFPGHVYPLPKPNPGGVYIDVKISPDSFTNEDKKENKSDAIEKSRPNKDSISWKFKCKE